MKARIIPWLFLALGVVLAFGLFAFAATLPVEERVQGDIIGYLSIAARFNSIGDAFAFAGDRTYGFPLSIYLAFLSRSLLGADKWVFWLDWLSGALLLVHIAACVCFYRFFLRNKFIRAGFPSCVPTVAAALIVSFPALVAHTATPLTDTFCVDLLMIAAALHAATRESSRALALGQSALCGLILGYTIMVRPSFWPAVVAFYGAEILESLMLRELRLLLISAFMAAGTLTVIVPALETGRNAFKTPCLQNPRFMNAASGSCIQAGLTSVRVYWSAKLASKEALPGVKDPYLLHTFGHETGVASLRSLVGCLLSHPVAAPFYFTKKTMALFDQPFLSPYAADRTPSWFCALQRLFELPVFCGFAALVFWALSLPFNRGKDESVGISWAALVGVILLTHLVMHIEGRYGLPAVPFCITALFLGFASARRAGSKRFLFWVITMGIAAIAFFYQILAWDLVVPT